MMLVDASNVTQTETAIDPDTGDLVVFGVVDGVRRDEIDRFAPPPGVVRTEDRLAALEEKAAAHDKLVAVLAEKGTISAKDVGDIAATADIAVEVKP